MVCYEQTRGTDRRMRASDRGVSITRTRYRLDSYRIQPEWFIDARRTGMWVSQNTLPSELLYVFNVSFTLHSAHLKQGPWNHNPLIPVGLSFG